MVRLSSSRRWRFSDRVSRAFHDYGRLCSAHPLACLSISILTVLFLSYPAMSKIELPISSPMDVYWSSKETVEHPDSSSVPEWLYLSPAFYVQQIIVKGKVEIWNGNLTAEAAVRASLSRSFHILRLLNETKTHQLRGLDDFCYRGTLGSSSLRGLFPHKNCIVLSPSLFWHNQLSNFAKDDDVHETIFKYACSAQMCPRDILLGTLTRLSGIKQHYQTNRHRSIDYAITLILHRYDSEWRQTLIDELSSQFDVKSPQTFDEIFVHVFYLPRKYFTDYFPLFGVIFLYFCLLLLYGWKVRNGQIQIRSCTGRLFYGVCYVDINSRYTRIFRFERITLESNRFSVFGDDSWTRKRTLSVVYTSPTLDVPSRLSQGLSCEGYSISKYFLLELSLIGVGYLTQVPQIQEFAVIAFIGIIVDMYMQLFFFTPCLTLDLYRMDKDDKERFSLMLFNTEIRKLRNYPNPRCPARYFLPGFFAQKNRLVRTHSETNLSKDGSTTVTYRGHRRASSIDKHFNRHIQESMVSNRLRLLYFWTKTRIVQRLIMFLFCVWVLWLAFIVHRSRVFEGLTGEATNSSATRNGPWNHFLDTAPLEYILWQRQTFKWWPALFAEYNQSLSGQYITFLPPIVLKAQIAVDDPILIPVLSDSNDQLETVNNDYYEESTRNPELQNRVYWLERQMTTMLVFSALIPFSIVLIFTLYACFWDRWTSFRDARRSAAILHDNKNTINKKGFVELAPLAFSRHEYPIECAAVQPPDTIVSASVNGRVFIWDAKSGELKNSISQSSGTTRQRVASLAASQSSTNSASFVPSEPLPFGIPTESLSNNGVASHSNARPLVWCLSVNKNLIALGCSNGLVQLVNSSTAQIMGTFDQSVSGIVHIELRGNRIFLVRLNGILEILEYTIRETSMVDDRTVEIKRQSASRVHKKPVTKMICTTLYVITASYDQTLRLFDVRSMRISHTLNGHSASIVSACVSVDETLLFSSCEVGRVCCWNLEDGRLLRSVDGTTSTFITSVELACTTELLIGFGSNALLSFWDIKSGESVAELSLREHTTPLTLLLDSEENLEQSLRETRFLAVLSDLHIATGDFDSIQLWDLQLRAVVKQVRLPGPIDALQRLDANSVLCCSGIEMFRITLPLAPVHMLSKSTK
ncbi:Sterol regulatory element-binding protein cleavage-activating protein [Aphelenchoides besseyi]|nr:Sterol regulatory element-binding protein cleavage-activating protein [Aphelenchoides besseyi]